MHDSAFLGVLGTLELEGPEEVIGLFEVWAAGLDLVDEVLNADDAVLAELAFDGLVCAQWDALFIDLTIPTFI